MLTTQDSPVEKEVDAVVTPQEEAAPKATKAPKVETIERPGSNLKLKAAVAYLALRLLDPSGVEDFKKLYPDIFE